MRVAQLYSRFWQTDLRINVLQFVQESHATLSGRMGLPVSLCAHFQARGVQSWMVVKQGRS